MPCWVVDLLVLPHAEKGQFFLPLRSLSRIVHLLPRSLGAPPPKQRFDTALRARHVARDLVVGALLRCRDSTQCRASRRCSATWAGLQWGRRVHAAERPCPSTFTPGCIPGRLLGRRRFGRGGMESTPHPVGSRCSASTGIRRPGIGRLGIDHPVCAATSSSARRQGARRRIDHRADPARTSTAWNHRGRRDRAHWAPCLSFLAPVSGPIRLGHSSSFGLGLLRPVKDRHER